MGGAWIGVVASSDEEVGRGRMDDYDDDDADDGLFMKHIG